MQPQPAPPAEPTKPTPPTWMRGPDLRRRWGGMPTSTFYDRLKAGLIPKPEYPFGPSTPYWRVSVIEAHERAAQELAA